MNLLSRKKRCCPEHLEPPPDKNELLTESIPKLIAKIGIPAGVAMFFQTMLNIVDTYFAGRVGMEAVAALTLSFPLFFLVISFGGGIGAGSTALVANAIGRGDHAEARRLTAQSIVFAFLVSLVLIVAGYFSAPAVFRFLGAEGIFLEYALDYIQIIFLFFCPLFFLQPAMNAALAARGNTKTFRNLVIFSFFVNCLLDPLFLLVFDLGVAGIGYATAVTQVFLTGWLAWRMWDWGYLRGLSHRAFLPQKKYFAAIAKQSLPVALTMSMMSVSGFIVNYFLGLFGVATTAGFGVAMRLESVIVMPIFGVESAALSLIGQAFGAGKFERVREIIKKSLLYSTVIVVIGVIITLLFSAELSKIFLDDPEVIAISRAIIHIDAFSFLTFGFHFILLAALQAIKKPVVGMWISLLRQIIFPVIFLSVVVFVFDGGVRELFWAWLINIYLSVIILIFWARRVFVRELKSN